MNRTLSFVGGLLLLAANKLNAQSVIFTSDFEGETLPTGFVQHDMDGNEPSRGMKKYGLQVGTAWVTTEEIGADGSSDATNRVALSGSWYKEEAQSNDWLITPAIKIEDPRTILSWRAKATSAEHPDGYLVLISSKGNTPEDFTDTPLLAIPAEATEWATHELSLESYAGQEVYVAFVNNSANCDLLMLDDIKVYTHEHSFLYENLTPEAVAEAGAVNVSCAITSSGFLPVEGYVATLTYDGRTSTIDKSAESLAPGRIDTLVFDLPLQASMNATVDYTLTISTMSGADVVSENNSLTCFPRTVLIEEGTATWCMWCPRGQLGLQLLHEAHPDEFVDVAVHIDDPMAVTDYASHLIPFFKEGVPHCVMNRSEQFTGDPYTGVEELYQRAKKMGALGTIGMEATLSDDNTITVESKVVLGKDIVDERFALSFILVEDSVTGYAQNNGFSGGSTEMGGLEDLGDPIPPGEYFFANVARAVFPSATGQGAMLPLGTPRHTTMSTRHTTTLPEGIQRIEKLKVVGMIIDRWSGEVVNAAQATLNRSTGISTALSKNKCSIAYVSDELRISTDEPMQSVELFDMSGRCVHQSLPAGLSHVIKMKGNGTFCIAKIRTATQVHNVKVVMNR